MKTTLLKYYRAMRRRFGRQDWWPGETPFEVMVGAVLTQNTNWANVERAIANLKSARLLDPRRIDDLDARTLGAAIRPAGYFRVKAKRLKSYVRWYLERFDGDPARMKELSPGALRDDLLAVNGIGPETADSILLYALDIPKFVVDAYTYRVLTRHHLVAEGDGYEEMQDLFESHLPADAELYNDFHAQFVAVGKDFCKPKPKCKGCPLERYLP